MFNLNRNEMLTDADPAIAAAIGLGIETLNRYPVGVEQSVRGTAARHFGVEDERLTFTRGIDEAVDRVLEIHTEARPLVVTPGFDGFEERLRAVSRRYDVVRLTNKFQLDTSSIESVSSEHLVLLASPNNPTGTMFSSASLHGILERGASLLVDETYLEFAGAPSWITTSHDRLFVFRSLSKAHALAGLRVGVLSGPPSRIAEVRARQWFCNLDTLTLRAVEASLNSDVWRRNAEAVMLSRAHLTVSLRALGFEVTESQASFVLVREGHRSSKLIEFLGDRNIAVRDASTLGAPGSVRISIGSASANEQLIAALSAWHREHQTLK